MTTLEVRQQAEIDRLRAALRSIADQCDRVLSVRWNEAWEVTARVQQIGLTAAKMVEEVPSERA